MQLGKGEGIIFGKDVSNEEWENLLERSGLLSSKSTTSSAHHFVLQQYVKQRKFDLLIDADKTVRWSVVGTMFCINDEFLGTSTWRAGPTDLTAISRGGTFLGGVTDDDFVPQSRTRALSAHICLSSDKINPDRHHIDQVIDCLRREGVALINLTCEQDVDTKYLMSIAEAMGTPLSHSDTIGPVWDVRSQGAPGGIDSGSRSHGMDEFEWHTVSVPVLFLLSLISRLFTLTDQFPFYTGLLL